MSSKLIDNAPKIIREAARTPLGLLALVLLLVAFIALVFFAGAPVGVRVAIFAMLLVGTGFFVATVARTMISHSITPSSPEPTPDAARSAKKPPGIRTIAVPFNTFDAQSWDALVREEDTYLVMSSDVGFELVHDPPDRLGKQAATVEPKALGAVHVKETAPPQLLAIVHDLDREPSWSESSIELALRNVLDLAAERHLGRIALPILAFRYGMTVLRFVDLLNAAISERPTLYPNEIGVILPADVDADVLSPSRNIS